MAKVIVIALSNVSAKRRFAVGVGSGVFVHLFLFSAWIGVN